jgi:hypothetical protein
MVKVSRDDNTHPELNSPLGHSTRETDSIIIAANMSRDGELIM